MQYEESGEMLKYALSVYTGQDEPLLKNLISWETNLNEILFSFIIFKVFFFLKSKIWR